MHGIAWVIGRTQARRKTGTMYRAPTKPRWWTEVRRRRRQDGGATKADPGTKYRAPTKTIDLGSAGAGLAWCCTIGG